MADIAFQEELIEVFESLNLFIEQSNQEARKEGLNSILKQKVQIAGQTALLLADLPFSVTGTMDLDVVSVLHHGVFKKLSELLVEKGLRLEADGHLIWMPQATQYETLVDLPCVEVCVAKAEFVLASKFKFRRAKDKNLINVYLEYFPESKGRIKALSGK